MTEPKLSPVGSPDVVWHRSAPTSQVAPSDELLALVRQRAPDPSVLDELPAPLLFARAQISNTNTDTYLTQMCAKQSCPVMPGVENCTLGQFARDAAAGVSVQNSHQRGYGLGRSLTGQLIGAGGNGISRVTSDFYITPGMSLSGVNSDEVITAIRLGQIVDTSVGFKGGVMRCSLCDRSIWDYDCPHIPGVSYVKDDKGNWARAEDGEDGVMTVVKVHGSGLAEFSPVFSGATPEAEITSVKANQEVEAGRMTPGLALFLEQHYRVALPASAKVTRFPGVDVPKPKEARVDPIISNEEAEQVRSALTGAGFTAEPILPGVRAVIERAGLVTGLEEQVRSLTARVAELTPLSEDGRAYRTALVEEAIAAGVRAFGNDWKVDVYRPMLERSDVALVRQMRDDWRKIGDATYSGGRKTGDGSGGAVVSPDDSGTPRRAYSV